MKNLLVTCSGGETSMTVTLYCLEHLKKEYNICVVYANTGVESNKTLDFLNRCQNDFEIPINWMLKFITDKENQLDITKLIIKVQQEIQIGKQIKKLHLKKLLKNTDFQIIQDYIVQES